ncbi:N-acetylmuramoyl-L-alanine amidase family protein [Zobellia sp. B3R18]|uniref:N-acetylmuramoyl-L-alanine amidase family protein n=1 Tax=Zobellia sp. B3R18 TaxID=2841568 RepID=UPI002091A340|nr:N-acetylmuramoyl-L-alanine amidase [Zobellia sp. B3R18]
MKAYKHSENMRVRRFLLFPIVFLTLLLSSFYKNNAQDNDNDKFVVVLDAGHGGHDPGNLGNGYLEKKIALNIVLKAGKELEKNPDIKVIYTRDDDTFVDLYERGQIANKANADLFVSVHCDSHTSNAHGAGTFVLGLHANKQNFEIAKKENSVIYLEDNYKAKYADYDINSPESVIGLTIMQEEFLDQSIALAKAIQDNFSNKLKRTDRKVKQAGFIVLHQTVMPSVLVETGFLTNKEEGAYLNSSRGQNEMATSIADAILTYKKNAMANMADFTPNTIPDVPEPEAVKAPAKEEKAKKESPVKKKVATKKIEDKPSVAKTTEVAVEEKTKNAVQIIDEAKESGEKAVSVKEEPKEQKAPDTPSKTKSNVIYKIQIMASAKNIPLRPSSFNGLNRVEKEPYKNLFRYVYGKTSSLEEAKMLKSNADLKGYKTSYIVAYRDGKRIPFKDSLK